MINGIVSEDDMQLFVSEYYFQVFHALSSVMQRLNQSSDLCEATVTALLREGVFGVCFRLYVHILYTGQAQRW